MMQAPHAHTSTRLNFAMPFLHSVSMKQRGFLARQLATMINSGLPLNRAVNLLAGQEKNLWLKQILNTVQSDLEAGATFSAAVIKHPAVFDKIFVSIVVSGEQVGKLGDVLLQLSEQYEKEASFTNRVRGALIYPVFIFIAMIIVSAIMLVYIVPQLEQIFTEANTQLPWTTLVLISISRFLQGSWWLVLLLIVAGFVLGRSYLQSKAGERAADTLQLKIPGGLGTEIYMTRLTRTLGMLIQAGTPIIEAISITAEVVNNSLYRERLSVAIEQVKRGVPLSVPFGQSDLFPAIVSQMTAVGEQTGQLDQILLNLATYYEGEVDTKLKNLSSLVEPVIIVVIGLGVSFLVYSMLVPIYNIARV